METRLVIRESLGLFAGGALVIGLAVHVAEPHPGWSILLLGIAAWGLK